MRLSLSHRVAAIGLAAVFFICPAVPFAFRNIGRQHALDYTWVLPGLDRDDCVDNQRLSAGFVCYP